MSFKRTRVVMLSTNEKAKKGDLLLHKTGLVKAPVPLVESAQHLYFLSDDEIKEGDWVYDGSDEPYQWTKGDVEDCLYNLDAKDYKGCKKIIATTDKSLFGPFVEPYPEGVTNPIPQPSEGFIQKFVDAYNSGKPITEVDVEYEINIKKSSNPKFDLEPFDKLKINPKDNTITIKKVKDTWTRDEVVNLLQQFNNDKPGEFDCSKWIEENI